MNRTRSALSLTLLLLATSVSAYELPEVVRNMENAEKAFDTISFDFNQAVSFTEMNSTSTVTGRALFSQANCMRIEKLTPEKQLTVANGKTVWIYNPAFKQVWTGSWKGWVGSKAVPEGLVPLGGYMKDLQKKFTLSLAEDPAGGVHLLAKPKDSAQGYEMEFFVSTQSWLPERTIFKSESAVVVTRLTSVELNPKVTDAYFRFKAPSGVDVIPLN